ncbi:MAG: hypothetical protein WBC33_07410, partial [Conexibacter sp.]
PYLRNSAEVVAGFPAAMGGTHAGSWAYPAAAALVTAGLVLAWDAAREVPARRRWGLVALCAAYAAFNFKEGFVRMDEGHLLFFFGNMIVLFAVLPVQPSRRPYMLGGVAAVLVALSVLASAKDVAQALDPYAHVKAVGDQVHTLASPGRRAELKADLRARIAAVYAIPPQLIEALGSHRVTLWPNDFGEIAYA